MIFDGVEWRMEKPFRDPEMTTQLLVDAVTLDTLRTPAPRCQGV